MLTERVSGDAIRYRFMPAEAGIDHNPDKPAVPVPDLCCTLDIGFLPAEFQFPFLLQESVTDSHRVSRIFIIQKSSENFVLWFLNKVILRNECPGNQFPSAAFPALSSTSRRSSRINLSGKPDGTVRDGDLCTGHPNQQICTQGSYYKIENWPRTFHSLVDRPLAGSCLPLNRAERRGPPRAHLVVEKGISETGDPYVVDAPAIQPEYRTLYQDGNRQRYAVSRSQKGPHFG